MEFNLTDAKSLPPVGRWGKFRSSAYIYSRLLYGDSTVKVNACVAVCFLASVTFIAILNVPAFVGLPVTAPVVAFNVKPAGNLLPF